MLHTKFFLSKKCNSICRFKLPGVEKVFLQTPQRFPLDLKESLNEATLQLEDRRLVISFLSEVKLDTVV